MSILYRGYGENTYPRIRDVIKRAVTFAKKLVLNYYSARGGDRPEEIQMFIDVDRGRYTDALNYALSFFEDEENRGKDFLVEDLKLVDDYLIGAVKVYKEHLKRERPDFILEELDKEFTTIERILDQSRESGEYEIYTRLYSELLQLDKLDPDIDTDIDPDIY
jgi:hypothetical protein